MFHILFLLLCFTSCNKTCHQWKEEETLTTCFCYNSGKIFLRPPARQGSIELELTRGTYGLRLYVNIFSLEAQPEECDPTKTMVIFDVGDDSITIFGDLLEGGQRILLPPNATQWVINLLNSDQEFVVHVGRYSSTIISTGFTEAYQKLMDIPL
jgi:hypothetical protein